MPDCIHGKGYDYYAKDGVVVMLCCECGKDLNGNRHGKK